MTLGQEFEMNQNTTITDLSEAMHSVLVKFFECTCCFFEIYGFGSPLSLTPKDQWLLKRVKGLII